MRCGSATTARLPRTSPPSSSARPSVTSVAVRVRQRVCAAFASLVGSEYGRRMLSSYRIVVTLTATGALTAAVARLSGGFTASAQTACSQWDVTGTWQTHQGNDYDPALSFTQSGTTLSGR